MFPFFVPAVWLAASPALAAPPVAGERAPAVALLDGNPTSATYGYRVQPADFRGQTTLWYFRDASCEGCDDELVALRQLWQQLIDDGIRLKLVTVISDETSVSLRAPSNQSVAWLLDHGADGRRAWGADSHELVILGPNGRVMGSLALRDLDLLSPTVQGVLEEWVEDVSLGADPHKGSPPAEDTAVPAVAEAGGTH